MMPRYLFSLLTGLLAVAAASEPTGEILYPGVPTFMDWSVVSSKDDTLRAVKTSCGCTVASDFKPIQLTAGVARTVQLRYGYAMPGDYSVDVTAWGSDSEVPLHRGTFAYRVSDTLALTGKNSDSPWSRLDLATSAPGVWHGERTWGRGPHPKPWTMVTCQTSEGAVPGWSVEVVPVGDTWVFRAGFEPQGICGIWVTRARFSFTEADGTALPYEPRISLRALIPGPVEAQPRTAIIGTMSPGTSAETTVLIQPQEGWSGHPIEAIQETVLEHPGVHATLRVPAGADAGTGPWTANLVVSISSDAAPGKANGAVILTCSDGTRLRIPFLVTIMPTLPSP